MVLSTKDIIPRDPVTGEIDWDMLTDEERANLSGRIWQPEEEEGEDARRAKEAGFKRVWTYKLVTFLLGGLVRGSKSK